MSSMTFKRLQNLHAPQTHKTSELQNLKDLTDPNQPSRLQRFKDLTPSIDSIDFKASPLARK